MTYLAQAASRRSDETSVSFTSLKGVKDPPGCTVGPRPTARMSILARPVPRRAGDWAVRLREVVGRETAFATENHPRSVHREYAGKKREYPDDVRAAANRDKWGPARFRTIVVAVWKTRLCSARRADRSGYPLSYSRTATTGTRLLFRDEGNESRREVAIEIERG